MPKLNEYIGSLVSSITNARVMSDIQTVTVAEEYAKHHLLQHFSIPRMRIDDIEMTIPIALEELEEKTVTRYEPLNTDKFTALAFQEMQTSAGMPKLTVELSKQIQSEVARQVKILDQSIQLVNNLAPLRQFTKNMAFYFIEKFVTTGKDIKRKVDPELMMASLEKVLTPEIKAVTQHKALENLNVIVEAHKLREQKPENLIYIKLKISEDGMEWNRTENSKGEIERKLLPE